MSSPAPNEKEEIDFTGDVDAAFEQAERRAELKAIDQERKGIESVRRANEEFRQREKENEEITSRLRQFFDVVVRPGLTA